MTPDDFRKARQQAGLSISETADLLGIKEQSVRRFEMAPDKKTYRKAPALAIKVLDWFTRQVPPTLSQD